MLEDNQNNELAGVISFPFHIAGWLKNTMHLDAQETGAYVLLTMAHYQSGGCGLPDDDKKLSRIARVGLKTWLRMRPTIEEFFLVDKGRWKSEKTIKVLQEIHVKSSSQRAKALKRFNSIYATALPRDCQPKTKNQKKKEQRDLGPVDNVDNSKGSFKKTDEVGVGSFDIRNYLSDDDFTNLRIYIHSEWDRKIVFEKYNSWVSGNKIPDKPQKAFFGWLNKNASWLKSRP